MAGLDSPVGTYGDIYRFKHVVSLQILVTRYEMEQWLKATSEGQWRQDELAHLVVSRQPQL